MRHATLLAASLLVALACASASAQWKWRDASGRVTVSDLPPPSAVPDRDIISRPRAAPSAKPASAASAASAPVGAAPAVKSNTDPELEARRKRAADEQIAQQRQQHERDAAVRAENCNRARSALAMLSEGKRLVRTNAQDEVEVIDDKGRAEEVQRARARIASDCK